MKYSALQGFRALIKLVISHARLFMMISHLKIIAFQTITNHSFWTFYIGGKPVVYIIKRKIQGCAKIPDLFLALNMIFLTRSLHSFMRYHVQHLKKIWYFHAPMYYSLCNFPTNLCSSLKKGRPHFPRNQCFRHSKLL